MRGNRTVRYFSARIRRLPHLSSKEKNVLIKRLKKETLERIGGKFEVTEARIRQIEKSAIEKIKAKTYQQSLFKESTKKE